MKIKTDLVEVVNVECSGCGLISNFMDGWHTFKEDKFWYYYCPECGEKWESAR